MGKKVKWALLTMLGFATDCSTVKNAPQGKPQDQAPDSARVERQIRLMYGVRPPVPVEEVERQQAIREKTARKEVKRHNGPVRKRLRLPKRIIADDGTKARVAQAYRAAPFSDLYAEKIAEHKLRTLFWECTLRCNLACRHCGSDSRVDPGVPDMPLADFLKVLDEEVTPTTARKMFC